MVKLSVSKVARMLGLKRHQVQEQINSGKLQTHEGYVTTDSVRLAYPEFNISCEQDKHLEKIKEIREGAERQVLEHKALCTENERKLLSVIAQLQAEVRTLKQQLNAH